MILQFEKIKLYNFGSYHEAEIFLNLKGFCLVSGTNRYNKDNASSNGSGKSIMFSAICYALTGETLTGNSSKLQNIYIDENLSYVNLEFTADQNHYELTRYLAPKSDLKIIKNNIDISGKGIRESEKILSDNLPDLTKNLIASTILLGQGMPLKFSSFSPSGRKDLLEKLTKSDYMIDDLKQKVAVRLDYLQTTLRKYETDIAIANTKKDTYRLALSSAETELLALKDTDYNKTIDNLTCETSKLTDELKNLQNILSNSEATLDSINKKKLAITNDQLTKISELNESYNKAISEDNLARSNLLAQISSLQLEIRKLKSISDVCPTCGQKLPNVIKPDTTKQEADLQETQIRLKELETNLATKNQKYVAYKNTIELESKTQSASLDSDSIKLKNDIYSIKNSIAVKSNSLQVKSNELTKVTTLKENYDKKVTELTNGINQTTIALKAMDNDLAKLNESLLELNSRLSVVKKMETLVKRDLRGYLLIDIIKYLDMKAKEYCNFIFGNKELTLELSGNNLDISYAGKAFDNLSTGEKQKCDLILQFSIRDLLQTYLGYNSNILVLDEIFDGLDKVSTAKITELISSKLHDIESIFIISHHSINLDLPTDTTISVVKNTDGISEIQIN